MGDFKNRLAAMNDAWVTGKNADPGVPDGIYNMQLENAELTESSSSGKLMIKRKHIVLDGEYAGHTVNDFLSLETEYGPKFVCQWIEQMGYAAPDDPSEIEDIVAAISNEAPKYQGQVKKAKDSDFRNVTIKSLIDTPSVSQATQQVAAKASQPKPAATAPQKPAPKPAATKPAAAAPEPERPFALEQAVTFEHEGTTYNAIVKRYTDDGDIIVQGDDAENTEYQVSPSDLVAVEAAAEPASGEEPADQGAEDNSDLLAFCSAQSIEVTDDMGRDALVEKINQYSFKRNELTAEEVTLLESIGATLIDEPKPAPKPAVKTPAPAAKPAQKTPAPAAKKPAPAAAKPASKPAAKTPAKPAPKKK